MRYSDRPCHPNPNPCACRQQRNVLLSSTKLDASGDCGTRWPSWAPPPSAPNGHGANVSPNTISLRLSNQSHLTSSLKSRTPLTSPLITYSLPSPTMRPPPSNHRPGPCHIPAPYAWCLCLQRSFGVWKTVRRGGAAASFKRML